MHPSIYKPKDVSTNVDTSADISSSEESTAKCTRKCKSDTDKPKQQLDSSVESVEYVDFFCF